MNQIMKLKTLIAENGFLANVAAMFKINLPSNAFTATFKAGVVFSI